MSESFFKLIRLFTTSFQRRGQVINGKIAALCVIIKTRLKNDKSAYVHIIRLGPYR